MKISDLKCKVVTVPTDVPTTLSKGLAIDHYFYCPTKERYKDFAEQFQFLYITAPNIPLPAKTPCFVYNTYTKKIEGYYCTVEVNPKGIDLVIASTRKGIYSLKISEDFVQKIVDSKTGFEDVICLGEKDEFIIFKN